MNLTQGQQNKVVEHVRSIFVNYKDKMSTYRSEMYDVYKAVNGFRRSKWKDPKKFNGANDNDSVVYENLVNKAFEIEKKVTPKVFGTSPNRIVTFKPTYNMQPWIDTSDMADMVRDYLEEQYKKQDIREVLKLICKWGIRYGNSFAKVGYKYKIDRNKEKAGAIEYDEFGNHIETTSSVIKEDVIEEYPCLEYKGRPDMYYDPSYLRLEDMPAVIELASKVRLSFFTQQDSKFINTDKLIECVMKEWESEDDYKKRMLATLWVNVIDVANNAIKPSTLQVKKFYWYFNLSDDESQKDERLYEFRVVNDLIVVFAQEISFLPFEDFRVFIDTESYFAKGYLQSIIWLQNELNHQKITAQDYMNKALYPVVIYSPNSGVDPRTLVNPKPWQIIVTSKWWQDALANIVQYPFRDLQPWYWNNSNDLERQIQASTFTIDTANPINQNSLTNTATGAKIKEFESNAVTGDTRKEFEDMISRLGYKMIQSVYDNMEDNIKVPRRDWDWYRDVNKEAFKNALSKYNIRIEAWSSAFDSLENRRNDALAQFNLWLQAMKAWVPIDMKYLFEKVMTTFEWIDTNKLFIQQMPMAPMSQETNLSNQVPNAQPITSA